MACTTYREAVEGERTEGLRKSNVCVAVAHVLSRVVFFLPSIKEILPSGSVVSMSALTLVPAWT